MHSSTIRNGNTCPVYGISVELLAPVETLLELTLKFFFRAFLISGTTPRALN